MPIGKYYTYKCTKCEYRFTKLHSDVFLIHMKCPKCKGDIQILNSSDFTVDVQAIVSSIKDIFSK